MRQVIIFVVIAIVMSLLRRRQNAGTGTPTAPMGGRMFRMPEPPTASPSPPPAPATVKRSARPAPGKPGKPTRAETPHDTLMRTRQERMTRQRVEQKRTDLRRRVEAEVANAAATAEAGPHTEMPGGIDPRLLERDRTPQPTPTPLHPR